MWKTQQNWSVWLVTLPHLTKNTDSSFKQFGVEIIIIYHKLQPAQKFMSYHSFHLFTNISIIISFHKQVQLQNLMTSKYIAHFLEEVSGWQKKLSTADSVLSIWLEVQRTWSHLESIFIGSEDIRRQLPEDSKRFDSIDTDFKVCKQSIMYFILRFLVFFLTKIKIDCNMNWHLSQF